MANLLDGREWDYVVGSVHFLRDDAVDFHGEPAGSRGTSGAAHDPDKVWARYFETLGEAARSGLFDVLAHPDLVKVWGERVPRARGRPAPLLRAGDGRASPTRTWRSRCPPPGCASRWARSTRRRRSWSCAWRPGRPVALSSDAHVPEQLGYEYERAVELLGDLGRERDRGVRAAASAAWSRSDDARAGIGCDSHRLEEGRRLVLGGVEMPGRERGLAGHSDADVLAHAVIDALLGAAGLGRHRRSTSPTPTSAGATPTRSSCCGRCAAARASGPRAGQRGRDRGLRGAEAGAVPRGHARRAWRARSSSSAARVNVKFTTGEGMGFVGRGEGVAALAVATLA